MSKRPYTINKTNFIRQALSGYARTDAIVSELVQNADDAGANSVIFYFRNDVLEVHNNSYFTEQDFLNITDIASGGKRSELEKTGTWGTGFLAVFHVTDYPELMSSGRHLVFNPELEELDEQPSPITDKTVFRLPWRRSRTDLAAKLEARTWNDDEIQKLRETMSETVYRLILFLRHVNTIEVFQGDSGKETLLVRVHRKVEPPEHTAFGMRQRWQIEYKETRQTRTDAWLCYRKYVADSELPQDIVVKDRRVELAFPVKQTDWLRNRHTGMLYNFLPTPIETGLPFQINGSFFPDNNRNSILLDEHTQREKAHWNRTVIRTLANLFSDSNVIQDIRDQVDDSTRFYNLLPLEEPKQDYLRPIRQRFVESARNLPIVYHSRGGWAKPSEVFIGTPGSQLPQLASEYLPIVPDGTPQIFRDFLTRELRTPKLDWKVTARYLLNQGLVPGTRLVDAHKMINNREKLEKLYFDLSRRTKEDDDRELLTKFPICLDQNQVLWRFSSDNIRWIETKLRKVLNNNKLRLVDSEIQNKYETLTKELLLEFRGTQLVESLAAEAWPTRPFPISALSNKQLHSFDHLAELLRFIHSDLANVDAGLLAKVPLVRTESDQLWCTDDLPIYFAKQSSAIKLTKELGLTVVHVTWGKDESISAVYRKAKGQNARIQDLRPDDIISQLYKVPEKLQDRPLTEQIDFLSKLYKYLLDCNEELSTTSKIRLRTAPICLTSRGKLQPARDDKAILNLPTDTTIQSDALKHLDRLQLDYLIDSELIKDHDNRRFLAQILEVKPLSPDELIQNVIVKNYGDHRLDDTARFDLLNFIREQIQLAGQDQPTVLNALRGARLIYCKDGEYRRAEDVYLASSDLDKLFPDGYPQLYPGYLAQRAKSGEPDQRALQDTPWGLFLRALGVNDSPRPAHVVEAIRKIVDVTIPSEERRELLRPLYHLLGDSVGYKYQTNDPDLLKLREIAWLPASNISQQWFKPTEIFPASFDLVGRYAPILAFREPTVQLRELLNMAFDPPVSAVFKHLLNCMDKRVEAKEIIYQFLARHAPAEQIEMLRNRSSIWIKNYFWRPKQVFFYSKQIADLFRHRRGYIDGNLPLDIRTFFGKLGIREQPHPWDDSLLLLQEVAEDYQIEQTLNKDDLNLLAAHTERLGLELQGTNKKLLIERLREFTFVALVPDQNHHLVHPSRIVIPDQPELLKKFNADQIPVIDEKFLTPAKLLFFQQLGVIELSQAVKREIASNANLREDQRFELDLRERVRSFDRIAAKINGSIPRPSEKLKTIKVRVCNPIRVRYRFDNGLDWKLTGTIEDEPALYDEKLNFLYVKDTNTAHSAIALAKELERVFFSGQKESPVIEQILQKRLTEIEVYLNSHGYPKIYDASQDSQSDEFHPDLPLWQFSTQATSTESLAVNNGHKDAISDVSSSSQSSQQPALFSPVLSIPHSPASLSDGSNDNSSSKNANGTTASSSAFPIIAKPSISFTEQKPTPSGEEPLTTSMSNLISEARVQPAETPSLSASIPGQIEGIPVFTGSRHPVVPILPNNYGELTKKFGLTRYGDSNLLQAQTEIADNEQVTSDVDWKQSLISKSPLNSETANHDRVTVTRFTLSYANRYEGFLPLHKNARAMLYDFPQRIHCQTDFEEWDFELYADYEEAILYNQEELPAFLSAFEIPAGGIIYLERVHNDNFRLYWNRAESRVENVLCLELLENGVLEEYLIPTSSFRCEVSEYVLRAEKRFEDADALFAQALDKHKHGVFQTICEVFGEPGRELSYDKIYQGVMNNRMVAKASIDYQLQQRPCFVKVEDDLWHFEPQKGFEPLVQQPNHKNTTAHSHEAHHSIGSSSSELITEEFSNTHPSPYHRLAQNLQQEWKRLTSQVYKNDVNLDTLLHIIQALGELQKRLTVDLNVLQSQNSAQDDLLAQLWSKMIVNPQNRGAQDDTTKFLLETDENDTAAVIKQIQVHLVDTEYDLREIIIFPLLKKVADESVEQNKIEWARQLYQLLQTQGAGDFTQSLQQLEKHIEIKHAISTIRSTIPEQQLAMCIDLWQKFEGNLQLRKTLQEVLDVEIQTLRKKIERLFSNQEFQVAWQAYKTTLDTLRQLEYIWSQAEMSEALWLLGQRVFEKLIVAAKMLEQPLAIWRDILQLATFLPEQYLTNAIAEAYLATAIKIANFYVDQNDMIAAIAILEYSCFVVRNRKLQIEDQIWVDIYTTLSTYYALYKFYSAAYNRLNEAKRKTPPLQKSQLNKQIQNLFDKRADETDSDIHNWKLRTKELTLRPDFQQLIDTTRFDEGLLKLFQKFSPEIRSSH